ncbi:MAG: response regulator [bacterium]|nr:response regulator [bacterium]
MSNEAAILVVDRNPRNRELLERFLVREGYQVCQAADLQEFAAALERDGDLKLALVDIAGFDSAIWDYCEQLRDKDIPFLVISPRQAAALQEESIAHGARGLLTKPLAVRDLLRLIRSLIEGGA